jgi:hypothetical protein
MRIGTRVIVGLLLGVAAFAGSHAIIAGKWAAWFHGTAEHPAYWMNSANSRPMLFTLAAVLVAAATATATWTARRDTIDARLANVVIATVSTTGGAVVTMVVILFTRSGGPGNLFPIAIALGAFALFVGSAIGSAAAAAICLLRRLNA